MHSEGLFERLVSTETNEINDDKILRMLQNYNFMVQNESYLLSKGTLLLNLKKLPYILHVYHSQGKQLTPMLDVAWGTF